MFISFMAMLMTTSTPFGTSTGSSQSSSSSSPTLVAVTSSTAQRGNISSPLFPDAYPPDASYRYVLSGQEWEALSLRFLWFDLEPPYKAGCLSDYLEISTMDSRDQRQFRGRFCGNQAPPPLLVLPPKAELVFRSTHAQQFGGFLATYEFLNEETLKPPQPDRSAERCGGVLTGLSGTLLSPGYPRGYAAGLDCLWLLRVPFRHAIYLRLQELEVRGSITNCKRVELSVYDGYADLEMAPDSSLSLTGAATGGALRRFCGDLNNYPQEERVIRFVRNRLIVRFVTSAVGSQTRDEDEHEADDDDENSGPLGFRIRWTDVELDVPENCSHRGSFACADSSVCLKNNEGGACVDLRGFCIAASLACDGQEDCEDGDTSDERSCHFPAALAASTGGTASALLLVLALCCWRRRRRRRRTKGKGGVPTPRPRPVWPAPPCPCPRHAPLMSGNSSSASPTLEHASFCHFAQDDNDVESLHCASLHHPVIDNDDVDLHHHHLLHHQHHHHHHECHHYHQPQPNKLSIPALLHHQPAPPPPPSEADSGVSSSQCGGGWGVGVLRSPRSLTPPLSQSSPPSSSCTTCSPPPPPPPPPPNLAQHLRDLHHQHQQHLYATDPLCSTVTTFGVVRDGIPTLSQRATDV